MNPFLKGLSSKLVLTSSGESPSGIKDGKVVKLTPFCQVDVPTMNYQNWLNNSDGKLADLTKVPQNAKIAIIGAGMSGLITGFELLRAGYKNFTIYEAGSRVGGRFFSYQFPNDAYNYAELGAMRFPPTENCLFWYIQYLQNKGANIVLNPDFPDPGLVPTLVMYKGQAFPIQPNTPMPEIFRDMNESWNGFVTTTEPIILANGLTLDSPANISAWLDVAAGTYDPIRAQNAWQAWVNYFKDKSFIQGVIEIFCQPNAPKKYNSTTKTFGERYQWKYPEDIEKFGTVGTGIGGQSPLFSESFICIMRFTINKLEEEHALIVTGTDSVADSLANLNIDNAGNLMQHIKLNTAIGGVVPSENGSSISLTNKEGQVIDEGITYLVVATTNRSAEIELGIDSLWQIQNNEANNILSQSKRSALSNVHMAQSSKFFLKVKPWWTGSGNQDKIRCITTDTAMANFYTLDYNENDEYAVCLMNYVWEDLSEMAEALGDLNERYQRFLRDLNQIPGIDYIVNAMPKQVDNSNAVMIDWQMQKYYNGAFALTQPTQEDFLSQLYYNFLSLNKSGAKVIFAGDSYSWVGGWVEGALTTGLNAFASIVENMGGSFTSPADNPLKHLNAKAIRYDNNSDTSNVMAVGPFGGCSTSVEPFDESIISGSSFTIFYDAEASRGILNGVQINGKTYGTCTRNLKSVDVDLNQTVNEITIYACKEIDANGRVRAFLINNTQYGANLQPGDIAYTIKFDVGMKITEIKGMSGHDIDRIGFCVQHKI